MHIPSASHWGNVHEAPGVCYTYYTQLQYNMLCFGVATTQHVLLQTQVANKKYNNNMCAKKGCPQMKLDSKSVPSACEAGALPSELLEVLN